MRLLSDNLTLPSSGPSSYITPTPASEPDCHDTVFIVLQHSKSTGSILPYSNVVGVFRSREDAQRCIRELKQIQRPLVRSQSEIGNGEKQVKVWCTSDGNEVEEMRFQFLGESGEEFVLWIEKHQLVESSIKDEASGATGGGRADGDCSQSCGSDGPYQLCEDRALDSGHFLPGQDASVNMLNPDGSWRGPEAPVVALQTPPNQQAQDGNSGGGAGSEDTEGVRSHNGKGVRTATWY